jgi:hypothetical protein
MKAKRNCLILKSDLDQKENHKILMPDGSTIDLFIGRKYNENDREASPNTCCVVSVGDGILDISEGDNIIVHHNTVKNDACHIEKKNGYVYLSIPYDTLIYAKISDDGKLIPVGKSIIAERIKSKKLSNFDYTEKTEPMKFKVVSVPSDYTEVKPNQNILCYKMSDYEIVYHHRGIEKRAIRILQDDILGVFAE